MLAWIPSSLHKNWKNLCNGVLILELCDILVSSCNNCFGQYMDHLPRKMLVSKNLGGGNLASDHLLSQNKVYVLMSGQLCRGSCCWSGIFNDCFHQVL